MTDVLILCTANVCRSVLAQALLASRLAVLEPAARVRSAGLLPGGEPPLPEVIRELRGRGLDVAAHRSRQVGADDLAGADLVLTATREQLRHAVVTLPRAWPRSFTIKELVRRGDRVGPRTAGQPLADWLALAHQGRDRAALMGASPEDDIADPAGGPPRAYAATAGQLDVLCDRLARLAWAAASPATRPRDPPRPPGLRPGNPPRTA